MTLQSAASELELLETSVREAGAMARELSLKPLEIQSKGEAGPVTNVDKAVDAMLELKFLTKRPDYGWLSEETPDKPEYRVGKERTFMLDPIDGTAALIGKVPQWTISVGILEGNRPYAGVIYNPMTDEMFTGVVGHGAWHQRPADEGQRHHQPRRRAHDRPEEPLRRQTLARRLGRRWT